MVALHSKKTLTILSLLAGNTTTTALAKKHHEPAPGDKGFQQIELFRYSVSDTCEYKETPRGELLAHEDTLKSDKCYNFGMEPFSSFEWSYTNVDIGSRLDRQENCKLIFFAGGNCDGEGESMMTTWDYTPQCHHYGFRVASVALTCTDETPHISH